MFCPNPIPFVLSWKRQEQKYLLKRGLERLWICNTSSRLADVFYFTSLPCYGSAQGLGGQDNCEYLFEKAIFGQSLGKNTSVTPKSQVSTAEGVVRMGL